MLYQTNPHLRLVSINQSKTNFYLLYEITFTPFGDDESKHEPVSLKGEATVPAGAELEESDHRLSDDQYAEVVVNI